MAFQGRGNRNSGERSFGGRGGGRSFGGGGGRSFGGGGRDRGGFDRPEMHDAVCDECGKDCQVPFRPSGDKPIYCSDCFEQRGGNERDDRRGGRDFGDRRGGREDRGERRFESKPVSSGGISKEQFETLTNKLDKIIDALSNVVPREVASSEGDESHVEMKPRKKVRVKNDENLSLE